MRIIRKIVKYLFLIFIISSIFLTFYKFPLPFVSEIVEPIKQTQPIIETVELEPYIKEFSGVKYKITPHAAYEIYGLVVEQYDSENWMDVTHEKDPAQSKDLCLIWGDNIVNGVYQKAKYSHGEFTCYFKLDRPDIKLFNPNELTNNHLVPENETLKNQIKNIKKGDQVYIKGTLIDYEILDDDGKRLILRKTSTTMKDRGCEVVLVSDFNVLREVNPLIKNAKNYSYKALGMTTLVGLILLFI